MERNLLYFLALGLMVLLPRFGHAQDRDDMLSRYRLGSGKGWAESYGRDLDAQSFIDWMSADWGRPRKEWTAKRLGPLDAWRRGEK